jgi:hypothetical protein
VTNNCRLSVDFSRPAASASRGRKKRSRHWPGHHDHVRATEAMSSDFTSPKVHRRVCYNASVHMRLRSVYSQVGNL